MFILFQARCQKYSPSKQGRRERRAAERKLTAEKSENSRETEVETETFVTEENMQAGEASFAGTKEVSQNDTVEKSTAIEAAEEGVKGVIEIESDSLKLYDEFCHDENYFNDDIEDVTVKEILVIPEKRNEMKDENLENLIEFNLKIIGITTKSLEDYLGFVV